MTFLKRVAKLLTSQGCKVISSAANAIELQSNKDNTNYIINQISSDKSKNTTLKIITNDFSITIYSNEQQRINAFHDGIKTINSCTISLISISKEVDARNASLILESLQTKNPKPLQLIESVGLSALGFQYFGKLAKIDDLAHHVLAQTNPEPFDIFLVEQLITDKKSKIDTFVDVGTNTGLYCFIAAHKQPKIKKIHAFEPQPQCMKTLKQTVTYNGWQNKFTTHNCALGDKKTELKLVLSGTGSSFNSQFLNSKGLETLTVRVSTLDIELKNQQGDFLKIDVEGFELQVLKGATQTLNRCKPMIFVEIGTKTVGETKLLLEKIKFMESHGYKVWESTRVKLAQIDNEWKPTPDTVNMYLALHTQKHAEQIKSISKYQRIARIKSFHYYMKLVRDRLKTRLKKPFISLKSAKQ